MQETANSNPWNHIFNFQRRGPPRRRARKLVSLLPHSRECTKEPISALPNNGSKKKLGAKEQLRNILQEKLRGRGGSSCRFDRTFGKKNFFLWAIQHRCPSLRIILAKKRYSTPTGARLNSALNPNPNPTPIRCPIPYNKGIVKHYND